MIHKPVLLYDGFCVLCNGMVRFLVKRDKAINILLAPLSSESAKVLLEGVNKPDMPVDSVLLIENNKLYLKAEAILRIMKIMGGFWRFLANLNFIPVSILNRVYDRVAAIRYRVFGKHQSCPLPDQNMIKHMVDERIQSIT